MDQHPTIAVRVASYNIRAGLGTDLKRDAHRVLGAIGALDADVVALQEADHRLGTRPSALPRREIQRHTGLRPLPVAHHDDSLGWHGIALLARPEVELKQIERIDLPGLEPRGAVIADLEAALGPVRVVAVHLGLLRRHRRRQISYIIQRLAGRSPLPTVWLGDFNEWSTKRGLGRLDPHFTILPAPKTFPSRFPLVPLDRIAHCEALSANALPLPDALHPHPSDHRPVLADIRLRPAA